jgi:peptide deformylase
VGTVVRPYAVCLTAFDEQGRYIALPADGVLARCFAHEVDHLDGVMFTDRLVPGTTLRPVEAPREALATSMV